MLEANAVAGKAEGSRQTRQLAEEGNRPHVASLTGCLPSSTLSAAPASSCKRCAAPGESSSNAQRFSCLADGAAKPFCGLAGSGCHGGQRLPSRSAFAGPWACSSRFPWAAAPRRRDRRLAQLPGTAGRRTASRGAVSSRAALPGLGCPVLQCGSAPVHTAHGLPAGPAPAPHHGDAAALASDGPASVTTAASPAPGPAPHLHRHQPPRGKEPPPRQTGPAPPHTPPQDRRLGLGPAPLTRGARSAGRAGGKAGAASRGAASPSSSRRAATACAPEAPGRHFRRGEDPTERRRRGMYHPRVGGEREGSRGEPLAGVVCTTRAGRVKPLCGVGCTTEAAGRSH